MLNYSSFLFYNVLLFIIIKSSNLMPQNIPKIMRTSSVEKLENIEESYINYMLFQKNYNLACSLEKSKKIALCLKILSQTIYKDNYGIHLNKVAFFINAAKCEKKIIRFKKKLFFVEETVMQDMYPCYGRHNPVRTNFLTDNNYDKFYISSGPTDDFFFVYIHEFEVKSDHYFLYTYHKDIEIGELHNIFITVDEVLSELKLNREIISTYNLEEYELIYLREKENRIEEDQISKLNKGSRAAVCDLILNQRLYRVLYDLKIVKEAFNMFAKMSVKMKLRLFTNAYKNAIITQRMVPCFCKSKSETSGNYFKNEYFDFLYVSEGPRPNSVFVYQRYISDNKSTVAEYTLFDLIENVFVDKLKSIDVENLLQEDIQLETARYLREITTILQAKHRYLDVSLSFYNNDLLKVTNVRKKLEYYKRGLSRDQNTSIIFAKVPWNIHSITTNEIEDIGSRDVKRRQQNFFIDTEKLIEEIKIIDRHVTRIVSITKHNVLDMILQQLQNDFN